MVFISNRVQNGMECSWLRGPDGWIKEKERLSATAIASANANGGIITANGRTGSERITSEPLYRIFMVPITNTARSRNQSHAKADSVSATASHNSVKRIKTEPYNVTPLRNQSNDLAKRLPTGNDCLTRLDNITKGSAESSSSAKVVPLRNQSNDLMVRFPTEDPDYTNSHELASSNASVSNTYSRKHLPAKYLESLSGDQHLLHSLDSSDHVHANINNIDTTNYNCKNNANIKIDTSTNNNDGCSTSSDDPFQLLQQIQSQLQREIDTTSTHIDNSNTGNSNFHNTNITSRNTSTSVSKMKRMLLLQTQVQQVALHLAQLNQSVTACQQCLTGLVKGMF